MTPRYREHRRRRPAWTERLRAAAVTAAKLAAWTAVLAVTGLVLTAFIALLVEAL